MRRQVSSRETRTLLITALVVGIASSINPALPQPMDTSLSKPKLVVGKYMVGSPTFRIKSEADITAGKIFCAELKNGKKVLVSALHLIGPAGGNAKQFTAAECAREIRGVRIKDGFNGESIGTGGEQLLKGGDIKETNSNDYRGDLLAFSVGAGNRLVPVKLSGKLPRLNSRAFIISCREDGKQALFEGSITESTNKYIALKLRQKTYLPKTSGAPVVDSAGMLVGMVYGTNDSTTYFLNPGASIYLRLNTELKDVP